MEQHQELNDHNKTEYPPMHMADSNYSLIYNNASLSIKERENALFAEWKESLKYLNEMFVEDGVVNEDSWTTPNQMKVLFLLKEAVKGEEELPDLRYYVSNKASTYTWGNIARWTYGIRHIDENINWEKARSRNNECARKKHLQTIAVINVKKQPGESVCNEKRLCEYFEKYNRNFLPKQINIYQNLDIIICCGKSVTKLLFKIFKECFGYEYKRGSGTTDKDTNIWYYKVKNGPLIVCFYHPQARVSASTLYNKLLITIKTALREQNINNK